MIAQSGIKYIVSQKKDAQNVRRRGGKTFDDKK